MRLFIDASGGISGDMFVSCLISLGANEKEVISGMLDAASKLGSAEIFVKQIEKNVSQLQIKLKSKYSHLETERAKNILDELFEKLKLQKKYQDFGTQIFDILISAERKAHATSHFFCNIKNHNKTQLHEAQDIIIDIIGSAIGLQSLQVETDGNIISPVAVGDGKINFSHGILSVPAPATEIILREHDIMWEKGPVCTELCTPTGSAILAALKVRLSKLKGNIQAIGLARGSKILEISPLKIFITS